MLMWEIYGNTKDDIWELCRENVDFSHILPTYSLVLHKEWSTTKTTYSDSDFITGSHLMAGISRNHRKERTPLREYKNLCSSLQCKFVTTGT